MKNFAMASAMKKRAKKMYMGGVANTVAGTAAEENIATGMMIPSKTNEEEDYGDVSRNGSINGKRLLKKQYADGGKVDDYGKQPSDYAGMPKQGNLPSDMKETEVPLRTKVPMDMPGNQVNSYARKQSAGLVDYDWPGNEDFKSAMNKQNKDIADKEMNSVTYADGGEVDDYSDVPLKMPDESQENNPYAQGMKSMKYAQGGKVKPKVEFSEYIDNHPDYKYADGGYVEEEEAEYDPAVLPRKIMNEKAESDDHLVSDGEGGHQSWSDDMDMISRIVKKYSKGGMVANDVGVSSADKEPAEYDYLVKADDLEDSDTDAKSGDELSDKRFEHDEHDIISKVLRGRGKRDRMPSPA